MSKENLKKNKKNYWFSHNPHRTCIILCGGSIAVLAKAFE